MQSNHENKMLKTYTTKRFIIRPIFIEDKDFYAELLGDKNVVEHVCPTMTEKQSFQSLKLILKQHSSKTPNILTWIIIEKKTKEKIGIQTLNWCLHKEAEEDEFFRTNGEPEVGIMLCFEAQKKGYALEAMGSLVEYAFKELNYDLIHLFYYKSHLNTIKFLKKLGATLDLHNQPSLPEWQYQYCKFDQWNKSIIEYQG